MPAFPRCALGKKPSAQNVASPGWRQLSAAGLRLLYTVGDLVGIAVEQAWRFPRQAEIGATVERNRLARQIHDTLAQGVAAIIMQLETADALPGTGRRRGARSAGRGPGAQPGAG